VHERDIPLSVKLEALADNYGISEILSALLAICLTRAAAEATEGRDPGQWSEMAVKLSTVIGF
jgi:hypothetical protein